MSEIRERLSDATMACARMETQINGKDVIKSIIDIINEDKEDILEANEIDVKNNNGFQLDFSMINSIEEKLRDSEDYYRKVLKMYKNSNNYIEGEQTDNLGTICVVYNGNTYCLVDLVLRAILTHNSILFVSDADYMKGTNELILILIRRILEAYSIDENLVQILYTANFGELLSNSVSIGKVIAIGSKDFQEKVKEISKIEVICNGYNYYDLYIEDLSHIDFIKEIINHSENIDIYVKDGLEVDFEDYTVVQDLDEAIAMINFNGAGFSSAIFTDNPENGSQFLREVKSSNLSVNSSPLLLGSTNINIEDLIMKKNMFFPNPLKEGSDDTRFEFPTERALLEKKKEKETNQMIENMKNENAQLKENSESLQKENSQLKADNRNKEMENHIMLEAKDREVNELKRQLTESQTLVNKYTSIFRKSAFARFFGKIKKAELDNDMRLLS